MFGLRFNIKDPFCGLKIYKINKISKKNFRIRKKNFYGLQFLKAYIGEKNYKCLKIRTKQRKGSSRLQNSFIVNIKMIYATIIFLIKTFNFNS